MTAGMDPKQSQTTKKQEAAATLRESFLTAVYSLIGQPSTILTYEKSEIDGKFSGWNIDGDDILVEDLKTPTGQTVSAARIRTPDILGITFNKSIADK